MRSLRDKLDAALKQKPTEIKALQKQISDLEASLSDALKAKAEMEAASSNHVADAAARLRAVEKLWSDKLSKAAAKFKAELAEVKARFQREEEAARVKVAQAGTIQSIYACEYNKFACISAAEQQQVHANCWVLASALAYIGIGVASLSKTISIGRTLIL